MIQCIVPVAYSGFIFVIWLKAETENWPAAAEYKTDEQDKSHPNIAIISCEIIIRKSLELRGKWE